MIHPAPEDVAIIGLGSGDTAWAAGVRPETRRIDIFEILRPLPRLLERIRGEPLPNLNALLGDPRMRIIMADGRNALMRSERRYDVIEADALRPHSAYSGNLYSLEFFQAAGRRLKSGGLMCTWAPTRRTRRTFTQAFPYVLQLEFGTVPG